ncbi:hypothetical protein [Segetibacter koreensis]|uniref:hypothetical protein n=1 Tax=Segetibacter koreensis TaxID=398037 RepID=UPI00036E233C|nr:hypothetical protein [Segetibacter koreensis]
MTLYEFKSLPKNQQTELVWSEGDFVADRQEEDHCILLYQLYSFYVEVAHAGSENKFQVCRSFSSIDQLAPYLKEIDISGLFI